MHTIQFFSTQFAYSGAQTLFVGIDLTLSAGIYAVAGKNGAGKSTLLKLIAGELLPTNGSIAVNSVNKLRYLAQSGIPDSGSIAALSAGEKKMRELARLFDQETGTLLLDEPETHLDNMNRAWLLRMLRRHAGTVLIVSHDEELLSAADHILHLENYGLRIFSMRYAEYRAEICARRQRDEVAVLKKRHAITVEQRRRQTDIERQVRRANNAARRAPLAGIPRVARGLMKRNAEKTLGKIISRSRRESAASAAELEALRRHQGHVLHFKFAGTTLRTGNAVRLEVQNFQLYRNGKTPLWNAPLSFILNAGDRLHLQGRNGSGKSQFMAALIGKSALQSSADVIRRGGDMLLIDSGFSTVAPGEQVLQVAQNFLGFSAEAENRRLLGAFGYAGERVFLPFHALSSGEKMRLYLMLISKSPHTVAVILFDEAEAGLDVETKEAVVDYLMAFPGIVIFTSHDTGFAAALQPQQTISLTAN